VFEEATGLPFYKYFLIAYSPKLILDYAKQANSVSSNFSICRPKKRVFWYNVEYSGSGIISDLSVNKDFLNSNSNINHIFLRKKIGDYLPKEGDSFAYIAWVIGEFSDYTLSEREVLSKLQAINSAVEISYRK
jgi:hypothetical protein